MKRGRDVFPNYEMGAERLSETWLGCETSFLKYEHGGETSFRCIGGGRNVFPMYELGAKRLPK